MSTQVQGTQYVFLEQTEAADFVREWRALANVLRAEFDERGAALIERRALELETWISAKAADAVSVAVASDATGYSEDHIRRQLGGGDLPNAGAPGKPRVARGALRPKRGRTLASGRAPTYDVGADVRSLRVRRGEQ